MIDSIFGAGAVDTRPVEIVFLVAPTHRDKERFAKGPWAFVFPGDKQWKRELPRRIFLDAIASRSTFLLFVSSKVMSVVRSSFILSYHYPLMTRG